MNKGRLLLLGVALAAGAGAFIMAAGGGDKDVASVAQIVPKAQEIETVRVLVAEQRFERGSRIDPSATAWIKWPAGKVPAHFVTEEDEAFYEALPGMRTLTVLHEGEPIMREKLVEQGDSGMMAALLSPGMRAVSANLSDDATSSGFVLPGDRVDIMTTRQIDGQSQTSVLLSDVRVLAIDQTLAKEGELASLPGRSVTFELTPAQVEPFILARETQTLTLALRSIFEGETQAADMPADEVVVIRYGRG